MTIKKFVPQNIKIVPIILTTSVVPLVVFMKKQPINAMDYFYWTGVQFNYDFFSFYKANLIILFCAICLVSYLIAGAKDDINRDIPITLLLPLLIYVLTIILSTIFTEHLDIAIYGIFDRYQGAAVLVSYCILCYVTAVTVHDLKSIKFVLNSTIVSMLIITAIGLFQYFGYDLMQTQFVIDLILPNSERVLASMLNFANVKYTITSTLYNSNYVGSYSALILPICLTEYFAIEHSHKKIVYGIIVCGMAFVLCVGSMSRAGFIGVIISLMVIFLVFTSRRQVKWTVGIALYFVLICLLMNVASSGRVLNELLRINPFSEAKRIEENREMDYIEEIIVDDNSFIIQTANKYLKMVYFNQNLLFTDIENKELNVEFNKNQNIILFQDKEYNDFKIVVSDDFSRVLFLINDKPIYLTIVNNKFVLTTISGFTYEINNIPQFGFEGKEIFASGRGFIWSRTIPMLKDTIFYGFGPDTFTEHFPQNDIKGKINGLGSTDVIIDKPHNWYLQMAIETGVFSTLAVISFIGGVLYSAYKKSKTYNNNESLKFVVIGLTCSILGYCITAFFNDSVVAVAPVFWVFLGLCISGAQQMRKISKES